MKKVHIKKRQAEARKAQTQNDVLTDFDWSLEEKIAKTKEFKFLGEDKFKEYVDANVNNVMKWPVDVRRELAKKMVCLSMCPMILPSSTLLRIISWRYNSVFSFNQMQMTIRFITFMLDVVILRLTVTVKVAQE